MAFLAGWTPEAVPGLEMNAWGAGEVIQQLRECTALPEDPS